MAPAFSLINFSTNVSGSPCGDETDGNTKDASCAARTSTLALSGSGGTATTLNVRMPAPAKAPQTIRRERTHRDNDVPARRAEPTDLLSLLIIVTSQRWVRANRHSGAA